MYITLDIKLKNKITNEICDVYQVISYNNRWVNYLDYILKHSKNTWSFLCNNDGFYKVINYNEWEYEK